MTTPNLHSYDDIALLIAKGRAARAQYLAELLLKAAGFAKATWAGVVRRARLAEDARRLRAMDSRMLADIGLTRADIELAARGELIRRREPTLLPANESVAPVKRESPQAA